MEYGKLVELAKIALNYETIEEAQISVGKLLYAGSPDYVVNRLTELLIENLKEKK